MCKMNWNSVTCHVAEKPAKTTRVVGKRLRGHFEEAPTGQG